MENDATKYPVTEDLNAIKNASFGTISSQAAGQPVEGSTTTESNPTDMGPNQHEWAGRGTLVGIGRDVLSALYQGHGTLQKVADFVGVSKKLVLNKMNFFQIPRQQRDLVAKQQDRILLLAQEGLSIPELGRAVGLSVTSVRAVVKAAGVKVLDCYHRGYVITHSQYKMLSCPEHPHSDCKGYVREHILIAERGLGRHLREDEIVHHRNGETLDNRLENLVVMTKGDHCRLHNPVAARWAKRSLCKI